MTGPVSYYPLGPPTPAPTAPPVVIAAAVVVWLGSVGTAGMTALYTLFGVFVGVEMAAAFDAPDTWWLWLLAAAAAVLGLCGLGSYLAYRVWLGRSNAARWALALCSVLAVVGGFLTMFTIWPLALVSLAGLAVLTLLLLPSTARWTRPSSDLEG